MKNREKATFLKIAALGIGLMACSSITNAIPTLAPASTPTNTPRPTPTITATPFYEVEAGKTVTVESGGFSFTQVRGYEILESDNFGAYLTSPDEMLDVVFFALPRPSGASVAGMLDGWLAELDGRYGNFNHADVTEETSRGIPAIFSEFTGMDGTQPVQGRLAIYEPENSKLLYLLVVAYGDQRWEREGREVLEFTTDGIEFFRITAWEECPLAKNPDYGLSRTKPIMIGGGPGAGQDRIQQYLAALLGLHDEVISYYEDESVKQDGVELYVYVLRIGNIYRTVYFDTTDFEELRTPLGLTCSVPLPQKP
jgi:hypothetical protein